MKECFSSGVGSFSIFLRRVWKKLGRGWRILGRGWKFLGWGVVLGRRVGVFGVDVKKMWGRGSKMWGGVRGASTVGWVMGGCVCIGWVLSIEFGLCQGGG